MEKKETPKKKSKRKTKVSLTKKEEIKLLEKNIRAKLKEEKRWIFQVKLYLMAKLLLFVCILVPAFYILRTFYINTILQVYSSAYDMYELTGESKYFEMARDFATTWQQSWIVLALAITFLLVVNMVWKKKRLDRLRRWKNASKK